MPVQSDESIESVAVESDEKVEPVAIVSEAIVEPVAVESMQDATTGDLASGSFESLEDFNDFSNIIKK